MKRILSFLLCCLLSCSIIGCRPAADPNKNIDTTNAKRFAETCFASYMANQGIKDYTVITDSISYKDDDEDFFIATFSAEYSQGSDKKYILNYSYYLECKSENHFEILEEGTDLKHAES